MECTRQIVFLTGTRADFGKLKPLILRAQERFDVRVFVTGMHMLARFGHTYREVQKAGITNIYKYVNQRSEDAMDIVLAKTIQGFSDYVRESPPDMIVVHGDRVEALAGAIVGALNNVLVAHIEGGEVSGTIDGLIRHSVSKLSHLHFVANEEAKRRLLQLGEAPASIFVIGSPDLDVMSSSDLPSIDEVRGHYEICFPRYGVLLWHPVTSEVATMDTQTEAIMGALDQAGTGIVVIQPNNDFGCERILSVYARYRDRSTYRFFPSLRFEYFLSLLKHADFIIGNSSAGIREAPFFGVPAIDVGSRQSNRAREMGTKSVQHVGPVESEIFAAIRALSGMRFKCSTYFGDGRSADRFAELLQARTIWATMQQKQFVDWQGRDATG